MNSIKEMQRFKELYQKFRFLAENDKNFAFVNTAGVNVNNNLNKNGFNDSGSKRGYIRKIKPIEKNVNENDEINFENFNKNYNKKVYQFSDD